MYFKIYDNYIKFSYRLLQTSVDVRENIQTEMQHTHQQFPVGVVYQNKNSRSPTTSKRQTC